MEDINANKTGNKRSLATTLDESNANPANPSDICFKNPKSTKKSHKETNLTFKKPIRPLFFAFTLNKINDTEPAKNYIKDNNYNYILNYSQFKSFLENAITAPNPIDIAKTYTTNTLAQTEILTRIHPLLKDRNWKNRIHRLHKNITQDP